MQFCDFSSLYKILLQIKSKFHNVNSATENKNKSKKHEARHARTPKTETLKGCKPDSSRCLWLTIFKSRTLSIWSEDRARSAHYASLPQPTLYPVQNNEEQFPLHLNSDNKRKIDAARRKKKPIQDRFDFLMGGCVPLQSSALKAEGLAL